MVAVPELNDLTRFDRLLEAGGTPTTRFQLIWQETMGSIRDAFAELIAINEEQDQLIEDTSDLLADIILLNELITDAEEAIANVNAVAEATTAASELAESYPSGLTISAADVGSNVTASISAHDRVYVQADGTKVPVAVNAGTVTGLAYSTQYWFYYDDAGRTGGAVTFLATTNPDDVAQVGSRHSLGAVTTPAAAAPASTGSIVRPRGYVQP